MIYVWDCDGVIADNQHRQHYLVRGAFKRIIEEKSNKERFNHPDEVIKDIPFHTTIELMIALEEAGYENYILTARRSNLEEVTKEWLKTYQVPYKKLIMRPVEDLRHHAQWKADILLWLNGAEDIQGFFDNEESNCGAAMKIISPEKVVLYCPRIYP